MQIISKKTKYPVVIINNIIELSALGSGWLLGGKVGAGTVVTAISMGIFLQIFFKIYKMDIKPLKHRNIKEEIQHLKEVFQ